MPADFETFITRWGAADGTERANYQLFLTELVEQLGLPRPDPASSDTEENAYVFERKVRFQHPDGTESHGFIDLYRRGAFVCEAKQTGAVLDSRTWDSAMLRAHGQAQQYARALPATEGRPPFLIVTDVGRSLELYAEFTRSGATYVPFPDPRSRRIRLQDLAREDIQETLRAVWLDPLSLDPARRSARVTREIADKLAKLARSLESAGHHPEAVAGFLMRCLFTMFAEDVGLLPDRCFTDLLAETRRQPELLPRLVPGLWQAMNRGGFSAEIRSDVLRFNGGLFSDPQALPLDKTQLDLLIEAARADWRHVEPAIFGTLLERALDPHERHKLGAYYTPRAYVERLVMPTVIEPLRDEWTVVQAAALTLHRQGKRDKAVDEIRGFHERLCHVRVLDPACGSGNFLYVALEHLKRLEGEVLNTLDELGETQGMLEMAGSTVDPHQMLGLEINPRAARIAEAVLWIGYLQWHFRTRGNISPPEPVLKDFHNIENRDAVLAWDRIEYVNDEDGRPVTRWDGRTMKKHPVTGEDVPDETARAPLERYVNPRKAGWPEADFVVGNPPFIGGWKIRQALGDGYLEALWATYPQMPQKADFVMYWWNFAADLLHENKITRFGFITTNSLTQVFQRRVLESHLEHKQPVSLVYAIPDHPWVDSVDGAAVRIAMTVAEFGTKPGLLNRVVSETDGQGEGREVILSSTVGKLHADLKVGADVAGGRPLVANAGVVSPGVQLYGSGFILDPHEADEMCASATSPEALSVIKPYLNGRDFMAKPRGAFVIDFFGYERDEAARLFPAAYQRILDRVKPERDHNRRESIKERWWRFGWERPKWREMVAGLTRFISTPETAKHRVFQFLEAVLLPDNRLTNVASDDSCCLGVLSSRAHICWALAAGGRLEDRPIFTKATCFDPFPFPDISDNQRFHIANLSEQLDAHRKRQQVLYPDLTLTGMYNVLEVLRRGEPLTAKEKVIHEQGLVSLLAQIHDELDAAVLDAYGWSDLAPALVGKPGGTTPYPDKPTEQAEAEEELLQRLVDLNAERAAEEARGLVRWLRPDFQNPEGERASQVAIEAAEGETAGEPVAAKKQQWPKGLSDQVRAVRDALAAQPAPMSAEQIARQFNRAQTKKVEEVLAALVALGQAQTTDAGHYARV